MSNPRRGRGKGNKPNAAYRANYPKSAFKPKWMKELEKEKKKK